MVKIIEQNRALEKNLEISKADFINHNAQAGNNQAKMEKNIEELEEELRRSNLEKANMKKNYEEEISDMRE